MYNTQYHSECECDGRPGSKIGTYHDVAKFRKELSQTNYIISYDADVATLDNKFGYFIKINDHERDLLKPHTLCVTCSPDQLKMFDELTIDYEDGLDPPVLLAGPPLPEDYSRAICLSKISFSLLVLTKLLKVDGDTYYFDISYLPYLRLAKNIYTIKLTMFPTSDSMLPKIPITFVNEYYYVESEMRDKLSKYPIVRVPGSITQNIFFELGVWQPKIKIASNKSTTLKVKLTNFFSDIAMKGFYIVDKNIDFIEKITISTNSINIKCFNKLVINSICQTFEHSGNKVLYVPFNASIKHTDMSAESFFNNVIHSAILNSITLTIEYKSVPHSHSLDIILNGGKLFKILNSCMVYSQPVDMSRQMDKFMR